MHLVGKTYSLHGSGSDSEGYYGRIRTLADECLGSGGGVPALLSTVRMLSSSKRKLKKLASGSAESSPESFLLHRLRQEFSSCTMPVAEHLRGLPVRKRCDTTLTTSEEQYHLYMLEIELQNRLDGEHFRECGTKLAFLPHCLRDLTAECQSAKRGEDYVCKGCSADCTLNAVTKLLRRHGVQPYIWMTADLRSLFSRLKKEGDHPGVLGIACIPELVSGMRLCARAEVPVVGIPLDANRCARWWGEFYPNSVNLRELEKLTGDEILNTRRVGT